MANANGKHRRFPEGVRNFSTICDLYRQLTDIVALMSLMDFEKLRGKSLKIGKYLKTSDTFRNVGCVPLLTVMANANGKHRSFPEGYRSFFDHFRSLPASHGYYCINEYDGLRKTRGHSLKISKLSKNFGCLPECRLRSLWWYSWRPLTEGIEVFSGMHPIFSIILSFPTSHGYLLMNVIHVLYVRVHMHIVEHLYM